MNETRKRQAAEIIVQRASAYKSKKNRHVSVQFWTKSLTEVDLVKQAFGGQWYLHSGGFMWMLGLRENQLLMFDYIKDMLPEKNRLLVLQELYEWAKERGKMPKEMSLKYMRRGSSRSRKI